MSEYFNKPIPVKTGDTVFAEDVNIGNDETEVAFDLVQVDLEDVTTVVDAQVEKARQWAENPIGEVGPNTGGYSALHYSNQSSIYSGVAGDHADATAISEAAALTSEINAANCAGASNVSASESNASAGASQDSSWDSQGSRLTSQSYAIEPEDTFVNEWISSGSGGYLQVPTTDYSSLHYAAKAEGFKIDADIAATSANNSASVATAAEIAASDSADDSQTSAEDSLFNAQYAYAQRTQADAAAAASDASSVISGEFAAAAELSAADAEQSATDAQSVVTQDLSSVIESLGSDTDVVDTFIYDTTQDSDGGLWRERCQLLSWHNEILNTSTRGATREFPAIVGVVAYTDKVVIYDMIDPTTPMWKVFDGLTGLTCVAALNSQIVWGTPYGGFNFPTDSFLTDPGIVNTSVHDVAMTFLSTNQETELVTPTIAVATDGGISVIDGPAGIGTVVDITWTSNGVAGKIVFDNKRIRLTHGMNVASQYYSKLFDIPIISTDEGGGSSKGSALVFYKAIDGTIGLGDLFMLAPTGFPSAGVSNEAMGSSLGLTLADEDTETPANGMVNYITKDYQSGWMQGDIKGAWLADTVEGVLIDTGTVEDRSANANPLTVVGTGLTRTAVASGAEAVGYSGFSSNDLLTQAYNATLDAGTGDLYFVGWVKTANASATMYLFRRDDSSGASNNKYFLYLANGVPTLRIGASSVNFNTDIRDGEWHFIVAKREDGIASVTVDGVKGVPASIPQDVTNASAFLNVGVSYNKTSPLYGSTTLLRIGAGAPSDEQIAKIYNDEKKLFQEDTKCTLNNSDVQSISYDKYTNGLLVGTAEGLSTFTDLVATDYKLSYHDMMSGTDFTSVDINKGAIIAATTGYAPVCDIPAINLREELAKVEQDYHEVIAVEWSYGTDLTHDAVGKLHAVYVDGLLVPPTGYSVSNEAITLTDAPTEHVCIMLYKERY